MLRRSPPLQAALAAAPVQLDVALGAASLESLPARFEVQVAHSR